MQDDHWFNLEELLAHELTRETAAQALLVAQQQNSLINIHDKVFLDVHEEFIDANYIYGENYARGWLISVAAEILILPGWTDVEAYHTPEVYAEACKVYATNKVIPFRFEPLPFAEQAIADLYEQGYDAKHVSDYIYYLHKSGE